MKRNNDICNHVPEWYWTNGLHDAEIISIKEIELSGDHGEDYNCMEIELDSEGALFESDIIKIALFNYKLKSSPVKLSDYGKLWWMDDIISILPNNRFKLYIDLCSLKENNIPLHVTFSRAEIFKKSSN
ncbi:MAG: hypothetical protein NC122_10700 [Faecalibacterium sp.]|nr:hypothetical protein [Ruminococcus sp.]MCM1393193.1 hypothetical protein [Ruminococcus sp.]MCM1486659.1 hypothetical protein [Faecalibacterium sp.]